MSLPNLQSRLFRRPRSGNAAAGFVFALTLLGLLLRVLRLNFQPLWWDEGYSVWFATHPLGEMAALTAQDIHPPLYYALLHGWIGLFGAGPAVLRLLSASFGALAIPAIYLAGRRIFGSRRIALIAAALLAFNPFHIYYSQEIRMYGLVALLSTGILAAAWRDGSWTIDHRPSSVDYRPSSIVHRPSSVIAYILLTTAALYTQYYAIFLPIGLTLFGLWRWRKDARRLLVWLGAQLVVAALYLPWILYAAPKLIPYVSQKIVQDADRPLGLLAYLARHLAAFIAGHLEGALASWWPAVTALLVPLAIGWWLATRTREAAHAPGAPSHGRPVTVSPGPLLASVLLTALLLGWLISLRAPFFPERGERLLILALPPFVLLVAAAADALWQRWRTAGYVVLALIATVSAASLAAFYTVPRYADDDYRSLIAHVTEQGLPGDTVYCVYPWQVGYWRSYGAAAGPMAVLTSDTAWSPAVSAALDGALARGRVWFPAHLALGAILETQIEARLAEAAAPFVNEWHGPNTRLSAWAGLDEAAVSARLTQESAGIHFGIPGGGTVWLESASGTTAPTPAANAVTPVVLAWQTDTALPVLAVSLRLTDDLGQIWAQHDYEPLGGLNTAWARTSADERGQAMAVDRLGLLIPAGTPPGRYHVELVIRPKGSGRAIDALGPDGRVLGPAARLFDAEVIAADRALDVERLPIATRAPADLGDGLRFLGYSVDDSALTPGDLRKVSLFWQATARPANDYVAFVQLLAHDGSVAAGWEAPPGAAYPTTHWTPGALLRTQASFRAPTTLADGRYRLIAGLYRRADGARLKTPAGRDDLSLGTLTIRGRSHTLTPPQPQHVAGVTFGSTARLAGYDLAVPDARPGGAITLTLHWQALAATDRPYTVFVHLIDAQHAGTVRGYGDAEPGGGAFPTPGWLAGEYLADTHTLTIAADTPNGTYRIAIGFYDPASGERLRTPEGADQIVLETAITVSP